MLQQYILMVKKTFYHKGGFTPFEFEINEFVNLGENEVLVDLSNVLDYTSLPVGTYREKVGKEQENSKIC